MEPSKKTDLLDSVNQPSDGYLHALKPIHGPAATPGYSR